MAIDVGFRSVWTFRLITNDYISLHFNQLPLHIADVADTEINWPSCFVATYYKDHCFIAAKHNGVTVDQSVNDFLDVLVMSNEVQISKQIWSTLQQTLLTPYQF
jgi:hypothetical protein